MLDGIVPVEILPLVLDRIEAMRARRYDFRDLIPVQRFDIFLDKHLREIFIAHAACWIARAFFFIAQDAKVDAGELHQFGKRLRNFLRTLIVRAGATDPEEYRTCSTGVL